MNSLTLCPEQVSLGPDTYLLLHWPSCSWLCPFIVLSTPRVPASCQPLSMPALNPPFALSLVSETQAPWPEIGRHQASVLDVGGAQNKRLDHDKGLMGVHIQLWTPEQA